MKQLNTKAFRKTIYDYYHERQRDFPWRHSINPYHIVVSEIMLQQTQADRVIVKYNAFIKKFPSFRKLATAANAEVLSAWQGLGYNRRALALKRLAEIIVKKFHGVLPRTREQLIALPGIGPGTAGSILAFAFNKPVVFIETNIRTVFIHFFFPRTYAVPDAQLLPLIEKTIDPTNPRQWYWALMDYGVMLKKEHANPSRRSQHYVRQSKFKGSNRELRGAILRALIETPSITLSALAKKLGRPASIVEKNIQQFIKEGFLSKHGENLTIKK